MDESNPISLQAPELLAPTEALLRGFKLAAICSAADSIRAHDACHERGPRA